MKERDPEITRMMRELREMYDRQAQDPLTEDDKDKYGYPLEPDAAFSTDPLGYQETAMKLELEASETFRFLQVINRHSPLFYRMASTLEKQLCRLGSVCITNAVMEQQGELPEFLEEINIRQLRQRTAYIFRKCHASAMESLGSYRYNEDALSLSIRYADLDKRLLATGEKIELIRSGKLRPGLHASDKTCEKNNGKTPEKPGKITEVQPGPFQINGRSFPIDHSSLQFSGAEQPPVMQEEPADAADSLLEKAAVQISCGDGTEKITGQTGSEDTAELPADSDLPVVEPATQPDPGSCVEYEYEGSPFTDEYLNEWMQAVIVSVDTENREQHGCGFAGLPPPE